EIQFKNLRKSQTPVRSRARGRDERAGGFVRRVKTSVGRHIGQGYGAPTWRRSREGNLGRRAPASRDAWRAARHGRSPRCSPGRGESGDDDRPWPRRGVGGPRQRPPASRGGGGKSGAG